jgi:pyruvate kinase
LERAAIQNDSKLEFEQSPRACRIVCTIGPASASTEVIEKLVLAGMNVARLNFSHGTHESHAAMARRIREVASRLGRPVAILQDLQGHKVRTGRVEGAESIRLAPGQVIHVGHGPAVSRERIGIDYDGIAEQVEIGQHVYLDDGSLELLCLGIEGGDLRCRVEMGGELGSRKGVIFPEAHLAFPLLNERDEADGRVGVSLGVDMVAMSFVRSAEEILAMRQRLASWGRSDALIAAKIEDQRGVENAGEILGAADAVLIARGDLGVSLPRERVPGIQKEIIRRANACGVPAITATQMLESMTAHYRPTRAEVNDVYNAVLDGSDALMLSAETATGLHPVLALREMDRICRVAEKEIQHAGGEVAVKSKEGLYAKIAASAANLAWNMQARCILAFSISGATLRALSAARCHVPVYGVMVDEGAIRRLLLHRGLSLITLPRQAALVDLLPPSLERLRQAGIAGSGDRVVVVASEAEPGSRAAHHLMVHILE